jgi:hypothetical protein
VGYKKVDVKKAWKMFTRIIDTNCISASDKTGVRFWPGNNMQGIAKTQVP